MKNLWKNSESKSFGKDDLGMRVYSSRLLGVNPELVLHGGGNTSVKGKFRNIFGDSKDVLYVKGSGWDLISIEKDGFAPVDLKHLLRLSELDQLSDTQMVIEQKNATLDPDAPSPSVEAILHALIPYKFVDHTHADSVLAITNTGKSKKLLDDIYGDEVLIVPYVMPGFVLAKKIASMTKNVDWKKLKGMVLLNHGVFTFANSAKESYDNMIEIVTKAENYLKKKKVWKKYNHGKSRINLMDLAKIRSSVYKISGNPCIAILNQSKEAVGFSQSKTLIDLCSKGTLTPDHVIRTKPFPLIIESNHNKSAQKFARKYDKYFEKNKKAGLSKLKSDPKWAIWPNHGILYFGSSVKSAGIVRDINNHTIKAIQTSHNLDTWKPISLKNLFEVEYWDLEQAKLKNVKSSGEFEGRIALVTGAANGIGYACVEKLLDSGCAVVGLDHDRKVLDIFKQNMNFRGKVCDLTKSNDVVNGVKFCVSEFGGLDHLISNAGTFSSSANLEMIDDVKWEKDIKINLTSHQKVLRESIAYLKYGINPTIVFIGSRNVGAPGPGAGTYTIAKSGLTQMARLAAIELASFGIRVNIIHPDSVYDTNVWSKKVLKQRAANYGISVESYKTRNLLKTSVSSQDVADLVEFLSSSKSKKTTGSQIPIDGGSERII